MDSMPPPHAAGRAPIDRLALLRALGETGHALVESRDLPTLFQALALIVTRLVPVSTALVVSRFDPEALQLRCVFCIEHGIALDVSPFPVIALDPPGGGPQSEAVHTRRPVLVGNLQERLRQGAHTTYALGDTTPVMSSLFVPMLSSNGVVGVMNLQSTARDAFGAEETAALAVAANTAAVAIENVELQLARDSLLHSLEEQVAARTQQLSQAMAQLEAFSSSVSHDLRSPAQRIAGFAALLQERLSGRLDSRESHWLARICASSVEMQAMIDALLKLSQVERAPLVRAAVDVSALLRSLSAELREDHPGRRVCVRIEEGLRLDGDPALVRVIFANLLSNAWKYTSHRSEACIVIDSLPQAIRIRDDGAGFEAGLAQSLFAPFKRLHAESEFPGLGIGLAIVQRAAVRHGWQVLADAAPGAGASFVVCLRTPAPAVRHAPPQCGAAGEAGG